MRSATQLAPNTAQNALFVVTGTEIAPVESNTLKARQLAGKRLERELLRMRLHLDPLQRTEFEGDLNACIEAIRAKIRFSDSQRIERVFYAIERQGCTTVTEISEDTRLDSSIVKAIVEDLMGAGELYEVKRHVPGSDRPWHSIKSRRQNIPEVTETLFEGVESVWKAIEREAV